jgi:phosphohistidine swiveling domain-containing protein
LRFTVSCGHGRCAENPDRRVAEFPNGISAVECVERHRSLTGHEAVIIRELDIPFEGLL